MISNILLIGPMGAGKTTIANILADPYGQYGYSKYSLASYIDRVASQAVNGWSQMDKAERRPHMQRIGAELRKQSPNPLLLAAETATVAANKQNYPIVIDDGRLPEETEWAKRSGFTVIVVTANIEDRRARLVSRDGHIPSGDTFYDVTESGWLDVKYDLLIDTSVMTTDQIMRQIEMHIK